MTLAPRSKESPFFENWPLEFDTFHWHGDTFNIPAGAMRIASSKGCTNQAFIYGKKTVALQFHPEITEDDLNLFLASTSDAAAGKGTYIQLLDDIRGKRQIIPGMNELLFGMLETFERMCSK